MVFICMSDCVFIFYFTSMTFVMLLIPHDWWFKKTHPSEILYMKIWYMLHEEKGCEEGIGYEEMITLNCSFIRFSIFLLLPLPNNPPFLHCPRVLRIHQVDRKDWLHLFQCFPLYHLLRMECQRQSLTLGLYSLQGVKVQQTSVLVVMEPPLLPPLIV